MKYEGAYKGWGKKIRGNSCNMEVSCKPVGGGDVQSLRSSNYLKEKKVKCIRFTVKLHGLSCWQVQFLCQCSFLGGWEIYFFLGGCHQFTFTWTKSCLLHESVASWTLFAPHSPSTMFSRILRSWCSQGWMIKVSKWNFPNSWQTGSHDLRKVHSNYIIQFCTRFRLEILRAARFCNLRFSSS